MADLDTHITQIEASQAQKEVTANGLFDAASYSLSYGRRAEACSGLTWGYYGTRYDGAEIANGTYLCSANETTYMMVELATGDVFFSNEGSDSDPDWDDPAYGRCYIITTDASNVIDFLDVRGFGRGIFSAAATAGLDASAVTYTPTTVADWDGSADPGNVDDALDQLAERVTVVEAFRGIPQNSQSGNHTTLESDAGKHLYHPSGAGSGDTFTIDSNTNVTYEIGTAITFVNMDSNALSIAITSDTLYMAGSGATGSRQLAQYGVATAIKVTSTEWLISGTGLT